MISKSFNARMKEFVNYHVNGDGECNTIVLKCWADNHSLSFQERFEIAYFFAVTYCVESSVVLFQKKSLIESSPQKFSDLYKQKLIFQSDRKYVKMKNSFEKCLIQF